MSDSTEPTSKDSASGSPGAAVARWLILTLLLIGGLWLGIHALLKTQPSDESAGGGAAAGGFPPSTVLAVPVRQETVQQTRRVTGTLQAVSRAEVAAQEAAAVQEVMVDEGDLVEKGEVLAVLDGRRLKAEFAEARARETAAKAGVSQREAETKRADSDLEMKRGLVEKGAVSRREQLDAEREATVAIARLQAAKDELAAVKSQIDLLQVRQEDLEVKAPFQGRIVARHVDPGEWVSAGTSVVSLVSRGTIEAWLDVPERYVSGVMAAGENLKVGITAVNEVLPAQEVTVVADVNSRSRLFPVIARIDDLDGTLAPGMSAYADVPVDVPQDRLAIPVDALISARDMSYVFRVAASPEGQGPPSAEKVVVDVVFQNEETVYLDASNLNAGDQVITEGNERLFPGTPLDVHPASETGTTSPGDVAQP